MKEDIGYELSKPLIIIPHPELAIGYGSPKCYVSTTPDKPFSESTFISGRTLKEFISQNELKKPVEVRMSGSEIYLIKLDDGSIINKDMAVGLCKAGLMPGYITAISKDSELYLKGKNDGDVKNNLAELPKF